MNKEEFLKKLRKRLDILEDSEIEDIVSEYEGYIDEKVSLGLTEKEAVKELGDFEEIVNDLLAAYKVKPNNKEDNTMNKVINKISIAIDNFMDSLNDKSGKDILRVLIEIIIILFLICLLKIPFSMIRDLGSNIFEEIAFPIGNIFSIIWHFIIEISYIIVSFIFFIKMFEKRYFKSLSEEIINEREEEPPKEPVKKTPKKTKTPKEEPIESPKVTIKNNHGFIEAVTDICIWILKFFVIMLLMGIVFYLIGISVALGFMIYLIVNGVQYFGILLLLVSLFLGGTIFLELGINFIFNKRTKAFPFFSKLITIIVITGLGIAISAFEIASTEIIYDNNNFSKSSIVKEIPMTDNLTLYNYDRIKYDNSLENTIKIEYIYPNLDNNLELEIELRPCDTGYCLDSNLKHFALNKKIFKSFIENLKSKKIYAYNYGIEKVITISEANYQKLITNYNNYHDNFSPNYENNPLKTLIKTYLVTGIVEEASGNHLYLTLHPFQMEEDITTVKVPIAQAENINLNEYYDFTFEYHLGSIIDKDNIAAIFAKGNLIAITKSNNVGL